MVWRGTATESGIGVHWLSWQPAVADPTHLHTVNDSLVVTGTVCAPTRFACHQQRFAFRLAAGWAGIRREREQLARTSTMAVGQSFRARGAVTAHRTRILERILVSAFRIVGLGKVERSHSSIDGKTPRQSPSERGYTRSL